MKKRTSRRKVVATDNVDKKLPDTIFKGGTVLLALSSVQIYDHHCPQRRSRDTSRTQKEVSWGQFLGLYHLGTRSKKKGNGSQRSRLKARKDKQNG